MIVLDTQVWLRMAREPSRLSKSAASAIRRHARANELSVSSLTVWEAAWLRRRGQLRSPGPLNEWIAEILAETGVAVHAPGPEICVAAADLPTSMPADPCDRLIAATALVLGCPLVTSDEKIRASRCVETIW